MTRWPYFAGIFLLFSINAPAQNPPPASPDAKAATSSAPPDTAKKPKKVWTNDDMGSVKGSVSVVGDSPSASSAKPVDPNRPTAKDLRQQQLDKYRDQIQQLHAQIDAADRQIAKLKNFKAEDTSPSAGINLNHSYNMVPIEDQVKQLEDKKKSLQAKIEDLETEAERNGIDPGELR